MLNFEVYFVKIRTVILQEEKKWKERERKEERETRREEEREEGGKEGRKLNSHP